MFIQGTKFVLKRASNIMCFVGALRLIYTYIALAISCNKSISCVIWEQIRDWIYAKVLNLFHLYQVQWVISTWGGSHCTMEVILLRAFSITTIMQSSFQHFSLSGTRFAYISQHAHFSIESFFPRFEFVTGQLLYHIKFPQLTNHVKTLRR